MKKGFWVISILGFVVIIMVNKLSSRSSNESGSFISPISSSQETQVGRSPAGISPTLSTVAASMNTGPISRAASSSFSMSYVDSNSNSYSECVSDCPDYILDVLGNDALFCDLDYDLDCFDDCGEWTVEWFNAHCVCNTNQIFSSYSFNFMDDAYCCGDDVCQEAIIDLFSTFLSTDYSATKTLVDDSCAAQSSDFCNSLSYSTSPLTTYSISYSTKNIYSIPYTSIWDCDYSNCSDEVLSALNDQEALCMLEDLSCFGTCEVFVKAHCSCDSGALFHSYSFDFAGSTYCCGTEECQEAVVDLYTSVTESNSDVIQYFLDKICDINNLCLPVSYSYGDCDVSDCPDYILDVLGNDALFCDLDYDLDCFNACSEWMVEWFNAHCVCNTNQIFSSYSFDFASDAYCCGDDACQEAIIDLYVAYGNTKEAMMWYFGAACVGNSCGNDWYSYSTDFSYSSIWDCDYSNCSDEVLSALNDQEALCMLEDLSCFGTCELFVKAHCSCDSGALFHSYSFDFAGSTYCCGTEECQEAVVDLYTVSAQLQGNPVENLLVSVCRNEEFHCPIEQPQVPFTCAPTSVPTLSPTIRPSTPPVYVPTLYPTPGPALVPTPALWQCIPTPNPTAPSPSPSPEPSPPPTFSPTVLSYFPSLWFSQSYSYSFSQGDDDNLIGDFSLSMADSYSLSFIELFDDFSLPLFEFSTSLSFEFSQFNQWDTFGELQSLDYSFSYSTLYSNDLFFSALFDEVNDSSSFSYFDSNSYSTTRPFSNQLFDLSLSYSFSTQYDMGDLRFSFSFSYSNVLDIFAEFYGFSYDQSQSFSFSIPEMMVEYVSFSYSFKLSYEEQIRELLNQHTSFSFSSSQDYSYIFEALKKLESVRSYSYLTPSPTVTPVPSTTSSPPSFLPTATPTETPYQCVCVYSVTESYSYSLPIFALTDLPLSSPLFSYSINAYGEIFSLSNSFSYLFDLEEVDHIRLSYFSASSYSLALSFHQAVGGDLQYFSSSSSYSLALSYYELDGGDFSFSSSSSYSLPLSYYELDRGDFSFSSSSSYSFLLHDIVEEDYKEHFSYSFSISSDYSQNQLFRLAHSYSSMTSFDQSNLFLSSLVTQFDDDGLSYSIEKELSYHMGESFSFGGDFSLGRLSLSYFDEFDLSFSGGARPSFLSYSFSYLVSSEQFKADDDDMLSYALSVSFSFFLDQHFFDSFSHSFSQVFSQSFGIEVDDDGYDDDDDSMSYSFTYADFSRGNFLESSGDESFDFSSSFSLSYDVDYSLYAMVFSQASFSSSYSNQGNDFTGPLISLHDYSALDSYGSSFSFSEVELLLVPYSFSLSSSFDFQDQFSIHSFSFIAQDDDEFIPIDFSFCHSFPEQLLSFSFLNEFLELSLSFSFSNVEKLFSFNIGSFNPHFYCPAHSYELKQSFSNDFLQSYSFSTENQEIFFFSNFLNDRQSYSYYSQLSLEFVLFDEQPQKKEDSYSLSFSFLQSQSYLIGLQYFIGDSFSYSNSISYSLSYGVGRLDLLPFSLSYSLSTNEAFSFSYAKDGFLAIDSLSYSFSNVIGDAGYFMIGSLSYSYSSDIDDDGYFMVDSFSYSFSQSYSRGISVGVFDASFSFGQDEFFGDSHSFSNVIGDDGYFMIGSLSYSYSSDIGDDGYFMVDSFSYSFSQSYSRGIGVGVFDASFSFGQDEFFGDSHSYSNLIGDDGYFMIGSLSYSYSSDIGDDGSYSLIFDDDGDFSATQSYSLLVSYDFSQEAVFSSFSLSFFFEKEVSYSHDFAQLQLFSFSLSYGASYDQYFQQQKLMSYSSLSQSLFYHVALRSYSFSFSHNAIGNEETLFFLESYGYSCICVDDDSTFGSDEEFGLIEYDDKLSEEDDATFRFSFSHSQPMSGYGIASPVTTTDDYYGDDRDDKEREEEVDDDGNDDDENDNAGQKTTDDERSMDDFFERLDMNSYSFRVPTQELKFSAFSMNSFSFSFESPFSTLLHDQSYSASFLFSSKYSYSLKRFIDNDESPEGEELDDDQVVVDDEEEDDESTIVVDDDDTVIVDDSQSSSEEVDDDVVSYSVSFHNVFESPSIVPTLSPILVPTPTPTPFPSAYFTCRPTSAPTFMPTPSPTPLPTSSPTPSPTPQPTPSPTHVPTPYPTPGPSPIPTPLPTMTPTSDSIITVEDICNAFGYYRENPSDEEEDDYVFSDDDFAFKNDDSNRRFSHSYSHAPTFLPTEFASSFPTPRPTPLPTLSQTQIPSMQPTPEPTSQPITLSCIPSPSPTPLPTPLPTITPVPSRSFRPTPSPEFNPSPLPSPSPTRYPSPSPTVTLFPTVTFQPTRITDFPTPRPSRMPSKYPTLLPSLMPIMSEPPSTSPSEYVPPPTTVPSSLPSAIPTLLPTILPSITASLVPTPLIVVTPSPTITPAPTFYDINRTFWPTIAPSVLPTIYEFECTTNSDGSYDPTKYLAQAHPVITVSGGSARMLSQTSTGDIDGSFTRTAGFLSGATPGTSFTFSTFLAGSKVGSSGGGGSTNSEAASAVTSIVKSGIVYYDKTAVQVSYQVVDRQGRSKVTTSSLSIQLVLSTSSLSATSSCGTPSSSTGIGICTTAVSSSWFSTSGSVDVDVAVNVKYSSVIVATSSNSLQLAIQPAFTSLSSAGMYATVPRYPLLSGDAYTVDVFANTAGQALSVWVLAVAYDTSILTYSSTSTSSSFISAVITTGTGTLSLSTSGLSSGVSADSVTGSAIEIVTISFTVQSSASGTFNNALSFTVTQMVNQYSIAFATGVTGQVNDARGGAQTQAQVVVYETATVGIFAYTSLNELVNTAIIDGSTVSTSISTVGIDDSSSTSNSVLSTSSVSCYTFSTFAIDVSSSTCTVSVTNSHEFGLSRGVVFVSYGGYSAQVIIRVWYPDALWLQVLDSELGLVVPSEETLAATNTTLQAVLAEYANCDLRFQETELIAYANFSYGGNVTMVVDVTDIATFVSSDENVAFVDDDGYTLVASAEGTTSMSINLPSFVNFQQSVLVEVTTKNVTQIDSLTVVVYTGASWTSSVGSVDLSAQGSPVITLLHDLSAEGEIAYVVVYANYNDGSFEDITDEVSLTSLDPSLGINSDNNVEVEVGAFSVCNPVIFATWNPCEAFTLATGTGVVMLDMPEPTAVVLSASTSKLTKSGDMAASSPFSVATSLTLSVTVYYVDGSSKSFTSDSRTSFSLYDTQSESLLSLSGNVATVLTSAVIDSSTTSATLFVSFPGTFSLNATVSVTLVEFTSLTLSTVPYPSVSGYSSNMLTLNKIACSGIYQQLEARASGSLSDGTSSSSSSFYSRVTYALSNNTATASISSSRIIEPSQAGGFSLTASYGGVTSSFNIIVTDSESAITSISLVSNVGTSSTLVGGVGTTDTLMAIVAFDDSTSLSIASSGATSSSWISPSSLLSFDSSYSSAISVNNEGIVSLVDNYFQAVEISVEDQCGSGVVDTLDVYANLSPDTYDVDMGSVYSAPYSSVAIGDTLDVAIRVQGSSSYDVTAFQIVITFDSSLLLVSSDSDCSQGSSWSSSFECTTNDPVDEVLIIGSCGLSPSSGCGSTGLLTVATVTFTAVGSGLTEISGVITKIKDDSVTTTDADIVAGSSLMQITASRRLGDSEVYVVDVEDSEEEEEEEENELFASHSNIGYKSRGLLECDEILGDTNGDCVFDVEDVQYLQYYIGGAVVASDLSSQQLTAMDPDLDGDSDGVDISYLMKVVANKYRFLANFTSFTLPFFTVAATVKTSSSEAATSQTAIYFEIGIINNLYDDFVFVTGKGVESDDGVLVTAVHQNSVPGDYLINASKVTELETNIGVVVMVETLDATGATSAERQFSFYCTRLVSACVSVYGDSSAAFKPFTYIDVAVLPPPNPTTLPTTLPTISSQPTHLPSYLPTPYPTYTVAPSHAPTPSPTQTPTISFPPTELPTYVPSPLPTTLPSVVPSPPPSQLPTPLPTITPSPPPTHLPTSVPTHIPSPVPTTLPSVIPSPPPTLSLPPTSSPTTSPTPAPSLTASPSEVPTSLPTPSPSISLTPSQVPTLNPVPLPSPAPSSFPSLMPIPLPTLVPTPYPTMTPTPIPFPLPTSRPTHVPTYAPTKTPTLLPTLSLLPTPSPSWLPTPAPSGTPHPSPLPTPLPSSLPTLSLLPTPTPTRFPTPLPTPQPSFPPTPVPTHIPTSSPSLAPTTMDTVTVSVAMSLTANAPPTKDDAVDLRASAAKAVNLNVENIRRFTLTYSTSRRLETGSPSNGVRELATYTWAASFDVSTPISRTDHSSASSLLSSVSTTFSSSSFSSTVSSAIGVTVASSVAVLNTRNPSSSPTSTPTIVPSSRPSLLPTILPTSLPSPVPSPHPKSKPSEDSQVVLISVLSSVGAVLLIVAAFYLYKKEKEKSKIVPDNVVEQAIGQSVHPLTYPEPAAEPSSSQNHRKVYPESYPLGASEESKSLKKVYPLDDAADDKPRQDEIRPSSGSMLSDGAADGVADGVTDSTPLSEEDQETLLQLKADPEAVDLDSFLENDSVESTPSNENAGSKETSLIEDNIDQFLLSGHNENIDAKDLLALLDEAQEKHANDGGGDSESDASDSLDLDEQFPDFEEF